MSELIFPIIGVFVGVAIGFALCAILSSNREPLVSEDTRRLDFMSAVDAGITRVEGGDYWAILWGKPLIVRRIAKSLRDVIDQGMDEYDLIAEDKKSETPNAVGQEASA